MNGSRQSLGGILTVVLLAAVTGCGGSEFGEDIRVEHQHVVRAGSQPAVSPLTLPTDQPFAIHVKRSSQNPGATGRAKGDSDATPDGTAFCLASAANGATASAEFNIGHRVENGSDQVREAAIECEFDLKQELRASVPSAPNTTATAALLLVVLDSHHRPVNRVQLIQSNSDDAAGSATSRELHAITARLQPREVYDIMLFAKVDAAADAAQDTSARLDLGSLRLRLRIMPAQTQPQQ